MTLSLQEKVKCEFKKEMKLGTSVLPPFHVILTGQEIADLLQFFAFYVNNLTLWVR